MTISALPTPPARSMLPAVFVTAADAFLAALPLFITQTNAEAAAVVTNKNTVAADKAIVAADKATVAADKAIVAADKATVIADKGIVAADKATVNTDKGITLGYKNDAAASAAQALVNATGLPVNSQSAAYTLVLADAGKTIYHPPADVTGRTWTIPSNASVAFPIGTAITLDNDFGAGALTISINTDVLVLTGISGSTGTRTISSGGQATILKVTATRWRISGTGLA